MSRPCPCMQRTDIHTHPRPARARAKWSPKTDASRAERDLMDCGLLATAADAAAAAAEQIARCDAHNGNDNGSDGGGGGDGDGGSTGDVLLPVSVALTMIVGVDAPMHGANR